MSFFKWYKCHQVVPNRKTGKLKKCGLKFETLAGLTQHVNRAHGNTTTRGRGWL